MNQLFVYSRLERFDYRLLYAPDSQKLPEPLRSEFIEFAREVINTDFFGDIREPRFALLKRGRLCLVGLGCYNKLLGDFDSHSETRTIRGFFGVLVEAPVPSILSSLLNIDFYRKIYQEHVSKLWHLGKKDEERTNSVVCNIELPEQPDEPVLPSGDLNTDARICRVHPASTEVATLFSTALSCENADIALGLNSLNHATEGSMYHFHNISIVGCEKGSDNILRAAAGEKQHVVPDRHRQSASRKWDKKAPSPHSPRTDHGEGDEDNTREAQIIHRVLLRLVRGLQRCGISVERFARELLRFCSMENDTKASHGQHSERTGAPDNNKHRSESHAEEHDLAAELDEYRRKKAARKQAQREQPIESESQLEQYLEQREQRLRDLHNLQANRRSKQPNTPEAPYSASASLDGLNETLEEADSAEGQQDITSYATDDHTLPPKLLSTSLGKQQLELEDLP